MNLDDSESHFAISALLQCRPARIGQQAVVLRAVVSR